MDRGAAEECVLVVATYNIVFENVMKHKIVKYFRLQILITTPLVSAVSMCHVARISVVIYLSGGLRKKKRKKMIDKKCNNTINMCNPI